MEQLCKKAEEDELDKWLTDEDKAYIDALQEMLIAGDCLMSYLTMRMRTKLTKLNN